MTDDHKELREALRAGPTPGPWEWIGAGLENGEPATILDCGEFTNARPTEADRRFIAACSPATIQSLLDRVEAAEKANAEIAKLLLWMDREGSKAWARGLHITMDDNGAWTAYADRAAIDAALSTSTEQMKGGV